MKNSKFKHIVKESLKEAFYTKKVPLEEAPFGHKVYIVYKNISGKETKVPALISRNTISREEEYRISWFVKEEGMEPRGHTDFSKKSLDYILQNKQFTPRLKEIFAAVFNSVPNEIRLEFVQKFEESSTEFLKECIEELDSWLNHY